MTFTRFWTPVRRRRQVDELPETVAAGEPETGVLSLRQLMDSLGPPHSSFDPDSTAHFSAEDLRLRRAELEAPQPVPALRAEAHPGASVESASPLGAVNAAPPREARRLSRLTKVSLVLLAPAVALLLLPRTPVERSRPAATDVTPSAAVAAQASAVVPEPAKTVPHPASLDANGKTQERAAADHLAAGDFQAALRDYRALATRSPAHAAAVRILERKLRSEPKPP